MNEWFRRFAYAVACYVGSPWAFIVAVAAVVAWAGSGPLFKYSDHWQLIINTSTTIITFLMVFVINRLVDLQELTDEELEQLPNEFQRVRRRAESNA